MMTVNMNNLTSNRPLDPALNGAGNLQGAEVVCGAEKATGSQPAVTVIQGGGTSVSAPGTGKNMLDMPAAVGNGQYAKAYNETGNLSHEDSMVQISDILTLMHKIALAQRQQARESRTAERELTVDAIKGQADKMREQAQLERVSGWISAGMTMVTSAMQMKSAIKGMNMKLSDAQLQSYNNFQQAKTQIYSAMGQFVTTQIDYQAKLKQAEGKELEAVQKVHETAAEDEGQQMQFYLDVIRDARQKLEEVMRSQQESVKSIVRA
ncbi:hypothetical protein [Photobacterium sp. J15]|uniref:hypothetical protein n=1 Tax=Photobacterium sp. J15 TaxID=265901 RepID=UPI0012EDB7DB|nr:hypothetical protein [Photobacterium sp. J15]